MPRDRILGGWRFDDPALGDDYKWGCGYPSDKDTQRWMRDNLDPIFGWPDVVRFSWGPSLEVWLNTRLATANPLSHTTPTPFFPRPTLTHL